MALLSNRIQVPFTLSGESMNTDLIPTACVLIIGNEILSGRTQDVNLNFLATSLNDLGVKLVEARVIADVENAIIAAVNECRSLYNYVFTTGGIGPTHDDITAHCIAKAFGVELHQHPAARDLIARLCERNGVELNSARLRMASVPDGATLIENSVSGAPGFKMENVFVLAGVPKIMRDMFEGCRKNLVGGDLIKSRTVTAYLTEGVVADPLRAIQEQFSEVEIGSYPFYQEGKFGTNLVLRSSNELILENVCDTVFDMVKDLDGNPELQKT